MKKEKLNLLATNTRQKKSSGRDKQAAPALTSDKFGLSKTDSPIKYILSEDCKTLTVSNSGDKHAKAVCAAIGTDDYVLGSIVESQLINIVGPFGMQSPTRATAAMQFMQTQKPADEIEGLLLTQIYTAHSLAMEFAARAAQSSEDSEFVDRNVNRASRLMRAFSNHLESLNRHRGKGQQKVTVEHVHVHSGGQAVIAPVMGDSKKRGEG